MRKHFYVPFTGRIHSRDMRYSKADKLAYFKRVVKRAKKAGLINEQNQPSGGSKDSNKPD